MKILETEVVDDAYLVSYVDPFDNLVESLT